jgi:UDPglucose 6-dehydrogenase
MERPAFIFDGRNILDHKKLFETGFGVFPTGSRALKHF